MTATIDRRHFLGATAAVGVAVGLAGTAEAVGEQGTGANNRLVVGILGTGGRGTGLASTFQQQPNVEVAYVCDPDRGRVDRAADAVREGRRDPDLRMLHDRPDFQKVLKQVKSAKR